MRIGIITLLGLSLVGCSSGRGRIVPTDGGIDRIFPVADASANDAGSDTCASAEAAASLGREPVDIIWVVDNSGSMEPAVAEVRAGLNDFASQIADSGLDYRVIMLALRSKELRVDTSGGVRYGVCIPEPLAGDAQCGDGERFFHVDVDIKSTQPLEQFLGTLAQSEGYAEGQSRGATPWAEYLRPNARKAIVVVTDDDSRLSADQFETFRGGANPHNPNTTLPEGVLGSSWTGTFTDYIFHGLYGWNASNPNEPCSYPAGGTAEKPGDTYSRLVERTDGVRASICDGHAAWGTFFDSVANSVVESSRIACELDLPEPPVGQSLDPTRVNVVIHTSGGEMSPRKVADAASCPSGGGWYYDDDTNPTQVLLCPGSCQPLQSPSERDAASVNVEFGCATRVY